MLFKSVKCYFPRSASAFFAGSGLFALFILSAGSAWAQIPSPSPSVSAIPQAIQGSEPVLPYIQINTGVWYAGSDNGTTALASGLSLDTGDGFRFFDFTKTYVDNVDDAIQVDVTLTTAPTGSLPTVIVAKIGTHLVPIGCAGASLSGCLSCYTQPLAPCQGSAPNSVGSPNTAYNWAARYNNSLSMRIGFFPHDICALLGVAESALLGSLCSNGANVALTTGSGLIPITFYAVTVNDILTVPDPASLTTGGDTYNIHAVKYPIPDPSASPTPIPAIALHPCASPAPLTRYIPQDGGIKVDTSALSSSTADGYPVYGPGFSKFVTVGRIGGTPDVVNLANNDLLQRAPLGNYQRIGGFTNSPPSGAAINYDIEFALRDHAGVLTTFACGLSNVQTAEIYGFLAQDKCFIATATYGSREAAPVQMLRQFRDRVLLTNDVGRLFVTWYYDHSPAAADWLESHSWLRPMVLTAFMPVEFFAWLLLHPAFAFPLAGMGLAMLIFARREVEL